MRKLATILLAILVLTSCKKEDDEVLIIDPCGIDFATTVHFAAVGDEFSSGLFIDEDSAWPNLIEEFIVDQGYVLSESEQIGEEGATTAMLSGSLDSDPNAECKNLITLMAGVHDQWTGSTNAEFQSNYASLLQKAVSRAGTASKVICVTIPDYSIAPGLPAGAGTPAQAQADIEAFNAIIQSEADSQGALLADIYPISQSAYQFLYVPEDSLHADADQHMLWSNVISAAILQALDQ